MNKVTVQNLLLIGCIILSIHGGPRSAASISSGDLFLGVSPDDMNYYRGLSSSSSVKCKDGSKIFNKSQFNDDFCDCPDGSDEPGTSACPNGKFYCKNAGHAPVIVYSSRVNDGICDCCDGSDEYDGKTKCSNTCWEAGKAAREKLRKKIATFKEGVTIRQKEIEQAKLAMDKDEGELLKLKDEEKILKELVEKIKERKELIEKAEEKERLQKEKEEKERKEGEEANKKETKAEDNESTHNDIHDDVGTVDQPSQDSVEDHKKLVNEPELIDHSIQDGPPNDGVHDNENTEHQEKEVNFEDKAGVATGKQNTEHQGIEANFDDTVSLGTENQDENIAGDIETLSREELGRRIASRWTGEKTEQQEDDFDASIDKKHAFPDETPNDISEKNGYGSDDDEHKYDDEEDKDDDDEHKDDDDEHKDDDDEHKDVDDEHKYDDDEHKYNDDEHTYDDDDDESEDQIDSTSYDSSSSPKSESDDEYDSSDGSSWLEKIQKKVKNIFQAVNVFQKPVNISEAAHIRKEYDEYSAKLSKIQSRISSLKRKLKQDFGPEKEFYSFYGQCFETKQNKYVYKVCPFKEATQVEDHSTTRLGSWEKFEDSYRALQFLNGDKCWNGPDRSLKVKLRCGLKNELADVDEPSRCEYVALLSTPALCLDTRLKELENKLEKLSNDQPQGHDEL